MKNIRKIERFKVMMQGALDAFDDYETCNDADELSAVESAMKLARKITDELRDEKITLKRDTKNRMRIMNNQKYFNNYTTKEQKEKYLDALRDEINRKTDKVDIFYIVMLEKFINEKEEELKNADK